MSTQEIKETKAVRATRKIDRKSRANARALGSLQVPEAVESHFYEKGYKLRWVRCIEPKMRTFDNSNVSYILDIGGEFVTPQEIRSIDPSFMTGLGRFDFTDDMAFSEDEKRDATGIQYNDVVLMKIPKDYLDERQQMIDENTAAQLDSAFQHTKRRGGTVQMKAKQGTVKMGSNGETFFS